MGAGAAWHAHRLFSGNCGPAVHVLNRQVESITNGGISQRAMMLSLSIGVACSVGMAMLRVLTGISIYYILVPGYLAALGLTSVCRNFHRHCI